MIMDPKVLIFSCGGWWLPHTARAFDARGALAGLWISNKNSTHLPREKFNRCWPFHVAMKPFFHCFPQIWEERAFYAFFPIWKTWLKTQRWPEVNVVQAITGYATEPFDEAEKIGALKVADCPNSHPLTYFGYWQRECDLWCPGENVPIPRWMFARMNRELERADMIIVQSRFCKESMIWNGIPAEKVMVNPMGVDTTIFQRRATVPPKPRFVAVGTICLRKGHQYLFRAFERVRKQLPAAELICIGNIKTDFRKELPKWRHLFTHREGLSHLEIASLFQTCTAFVFPSQEEGIARAQIEALAAGLPVIGTHEGGATTLVEDGVEGFIVRGRDPQHIAEAMVRVATDSELCRRMGEAAHRKGAVSNTWQDYGDRLLQEYQRRLNRQDPGPVIALRSKG
jgi:glycosyltransferase involved in cell wall biosynthesis